MVDPVPTTQPLRQSRQELRLRGISVSLSISPGDVTGDVASMNNTRMNAFSCTQRMFYSLPTIIDGQVNQLNKGDRALFL
ncbi:hypothetical protein [Pinirhizobacter soli]|uniref:hypothetical protein n=1 Tax=Pinirhizobacter soli TaxID=2786953 RepID=UPI00202A398C|nr:hypothetical protein [Pinirhizobacter soli]